MEALEALIDLSQPQVQDYLERRTGARLRRFVSVSDLRQETLLRARGIIDTLSPEASVEDFRALLFQNAEWMIRNAARGSERLHGESAAAAPQAEVTHERVPTPSSDVALNEEVRWLNGLIDQLDEEAAQLVRMRMAGRTFREIAEGLSVGEDAARKRYSVAAEKLRALMRG